jgi:hypothetical protein
MRPAKWVQVQDLSVQDSGELEVVWVWVWDSELWPAESVWASAQAQDPMAQASGSSVWTELQHFPSVGVARCLRHRMH